MSGTKAGAAKRLAQTAGTSTASLVEVPASVVPEVPTYVVAPKRRLLWQGMFLEAGEVVPDAHLWPRIESWINTGRIVRA